LAVGEAFCRDLREERRGARAREADYVMAGSERRTSGRERLSTPRGCRVRVRWLLVLGLVGAQSRAQFR
jgi:hypothetical protein